MSKSQKLREMLSDDQILEWFDSPTTEYFFSLIDDLVAEAKAALQDQPFDADFCERLVAQRGNLFGFRSAFESLAECFASKSFEVIEDEQVGDIPSGRQSIN